MILTVTLNTSIDKLYLLPSFDPYTVMRVRRVSNTAGGKGLNVSRIADLAGEPVTAMGFVGGYVGQYFESLITQAGIRKAFTHVAGETRSCINGWDEQRGKSTEYLEPGALVTEQEARRFFGDFERELPQAHAVTISGSMPGGMPPDAYARMIEMCRQAGKPVLLDTSGETLRDAARAKPALLKPNTDEIVQLVGHPVESDAGILQAASTLHEGGIDTVVVSLGERGAVMVCAEGIFWGSPPEITPVNTVGCGDSMLGGFAVGLVRGWAAEQRLRYAVAVSAANALTMETGSYDPIDLQRLLPLVTIRKE